MDQLAHLKINWHLIGPLQSNKVKFIGKKFSYLHSVASLSLAKKISEASEQISHCQKVFLQINLSGESSKSGLTRRELLESWPELSALSGLEIVGLMTMPPLESQPEKNRVFFKELKSLGNQLNLKEFSMGTSHDYQIALQEGATWIRLGTMLFGERPQKRG
jgi:pyridoxal phosphate enzyme (YggS family)